MSHKWIYRPTQLSFSISDIKYKWSFITFTAVLLHLTTAAVIKAAPTHQRMSPCESSATSCIPSEGKSWGAQAWGQKLFTISCIFFIFSLSLSHFAFSRINMEQAKFNSPKALSCSLSTQHSRMHPWVYCLSLLIYGVSRDAARSSRIEFG